jgi:hypothetical protein
MVKSLLVCNINTNEKFMLNDNKIIEMEHALNILDRITNDNPIHKYIHIGDHCYYYYNGIKKPYSNKIYENIITVSINI